MIQGGHCPQSVFLTQRVHPFPSRTRKLSSAVATILGWRRPGKIAQRWHKRIKGLGQSSWSESVILTQRVHPFPSRTRKLSSAVATILGWRRPGKIAHSRHSFSGETEYGFPWQFSKGNISLSLKIKYSSLAQSGSRSECEHTDCCRRQATAGRYKIKYSSLAQSVVQPRWLAPHDLS